MNPSARSDSSPESRHRRRTISGAIGGQSTAQVPHGGTAPGPLANSTPPLPCDPTGAAIASLTPLTFPTSSQVALSVIDAISAPNCSLANAARLIQLEPMLSAKVVALSNSVVYNRSGRTITSVQAAVQLIGLQMLKTLAIGVVMRQMASGAASGRGPLATRLWDHSVHVAALAYVIARRVTGQPPDAAMFAGIIHELSGFCLLSLSQDVLGTDDVESARLGASDRRDPFAAALSESLAQRVGRPLLQAMCVPEPIIEAVAVTWRGRLVLPPTTLGDTLMLAEALAPVRSPFEDASGAERADQAGIDAVIGSEALVDLLEEAEALIRSLLGALNA
jgi:HD-like signal output (HDOD) protein